LFDAPAEDDLPVVSILICTRNRAASLRATLESIGQCEVPTDLSAELIVIDNGSTDDTRRAVGQSRMQIMTVRYVLESRIGQGIARNRGIAESTGQVVLFTDDDVRVPRDWIERMCRPILSGQADAVAGGVRIAPQLLRPWMTPLHRSWLASTEYLNQTSPEEMVGANMSFGRHVLDRVPQFDPELGPGALGQSDDALFSWQLLRAGYKIAPRFDCEVEHHFDPSRLTRASFKQMARNRGRCGAYVLHHWQHGTIDRPRLRLAHAWMKLWMKRLMHPREWLGREGMAEWEMELVARLSQLDHSVTERNREPGFAKFGVVKQPAPTGGLGLSSANPPTPAQGNAELRS
jgi:glycosyltransferase involved in cell wall biosynthesis